MPKRQPPQPSSTHLAIIEAATAQQRTAYGLAKATGLHLRTMQDFLAGQGSPTIHTVEAVAAAVGCRVAVLPAESAAI